MEPKAERVSKINWGRITIFQKGEEITITERPLLVHYLKHGIHGSGIYTVVFIIVGCLLWVMSTNVRPGGYEYYYMKFIAFVLLASNIILFIHKKVVVTPQGVSNVFRFFYLPYFFSKNNVEGGSKVRLLFSESVRTLNLEGGWDTGAPKYSPGVWLTADGTWRVRPISFFDGKDEAKEFMKVVADYFEVTTSVTHSERTNSEIQNTLDPKREILKSWPDGVALNSYGGISTRPRIASEFMSGFFWLSTTILALPVIYGTIWYVSNSILSHKLFLIAFVPVVALPCLYSFTFKFLHYFTAEELSISSKAIAHKVKIFGIAIYSQNKTTAQWYHVVTKKVKARTVLPFVTQEEENIFIAGEGWEMKFPLFQEYANERDERIKRILQERLNR